MTESAATSQLPPKPRIVRVIARLNVGGPARHVAWVSAGLAEHGYDSHLITGTVPAGEDDMQDFARNQGLDPIVIPQMSREISWKDLFVTWKLYRHFCNLHPDIVHTHTAKAGFAGRTAAWFYRWFTLGTLIGKPRRCRVVHTYHGHVFHSYYGKWKTRLLLFVERLLARLATDRIIVLSQQQLSEIHNQFGVGRPQQFRIIPLGIDLAPFADFTQHRNELRNELKLADQDILVGIVGRLVPVKNHALFLRMIAQFRQQYADQSNHRVHFVLIGNGPLRESLEQQAQKLNIENDVTFLGKRDQPQLFYPALDVVALTSNNEGTPLTIIEAFANGRAVLATAVGGVPELLGGTTADITDSGFQQRERGITAPPGNEVALAAGLYHLLIDDQFRKQMLTDGPAYAQETHDKARLVENLSALYDELTG